MTQLPKTTTPQQEEYDEKTVEGLGLGGDIEGYDLLDQDQDSSSESGGICEGLFNTHLDQEGYNDKHDQDQGPTTTTTAPECGCENRYGHSWLGRGNHPRRGRVDHYNQAHHHGHGHGRGYHQDQGSPERARFPGPMFPPFPHGHGREHHSPGRGRGGHHGRGRPRHHHGPPPFPPGPLRHRDPPPPGPPGHHCPPPSPGRAGHHAPPPPPGPYGRCGHHRDHGPPPPPGHGPRHYGTPPPGFPGHWHHGSPPPTGCEHIPGPPPPPGCGHECGPPPPGHGPGHHGHRDHQGRGPRPKGPHWRDHRGPPIPGHQSCACTPPPCECEVNNPPGRGDRPFPFAHQGYGLLRGLREHGRHDHRSHGLGYDRKYGHGHGYGGRHTFFPEEIIA